MAIIKANKGHGTLVAANTNKGCVSRDYLLGEGIYFDEYHGQRAQKVTYINIAPDIPEMNITWDKTMDLVRSGYGKDKTPNGKPARTFNHYIFSPRPEDNITAEELDEAIQEWCERVFRNKFQIVIVYHNDNTNKVEHGHVVINNVNFDVDDPYTTIGSYVTPQCWNYASQLWQYMCKERGWYNFLEKSKADIANINNNVYADEVKENHYKKPEINQLFEIDENYFKEYKYYNPDIDYKRPFQKVKGQQAKAVKKPLSTKNGSHYTKGQLEAKARGEQLWTDDIRHCIEIAYMNTEDIDQCRDYLEKMGVGVENTNENDWKYTHPTQKEHKVRGAKLGKDYTKRNLLYRFNHILESKDVKHPHKHIPAKLKQEIMYKTNVLMQNTKIETISSLNNGNKPTLEDIAISMRICGYYGVWTEEELNKISDKLTQQLDTYTEIKNGNIDAKQPLYKQYVEGISNNYPPTQKSIDAIKTTISTLNRLDKISAEKVKDVAKRQYEKEHPKILKPKPTQPKEQPKRIYARVNPVSGLIFPEDIGLPLTEADAKRYGYTKDGKKIPGYFSGVSYSSSSVSSPSTSQPSVSAPAQSQSHSSRGAR